MIWRIAVRNLTQHRAKTLIIGSLIAVAIMLTLVGNSIIATMRSSISSSFTEIYTGEILVTSTEGLGSGVFGAQSDDVMAPPVIPVLKDYDRALERVKAVQELRTWTHQMSGYVMYNFEEKGMSFSLVFGVDPDHYWQAMDNVKILEGRRLESGEEGIMLNIALVESFKNDLQVEVKPGDMIQLNSIGDMGFKIREVPVVGIFEFKRANKRIFTPSFVDVRTLRVLLGRYAGPAEKVEVSPEATQLLEQDLDALFADDMFGSDPFAADIPEEQAPVEISSAPVDEETLLGVLGDSTARPVTNPDDGSWHFIVARLDQGVNPAPIIAKLNAEFAAAGIDARAQGWEISAAPDSITFMFLGIVFNVAMWLLSVVSVIIIMNTLVISVMERTGEIGTMRALGAQKGFVRKMFVYETLAITVIAGAVGIALGIAVTLALGAAGIPADNDFLAVIYGGSTLRPTISAGPFAQVLALILFIGLTAWIYPVRLALKVSPLKAIATE
jgi:putative ABC transport system permease protein